MSRPIVIYHAGCPDGFGAAWSFYQKYGLDADYHPAKHGDEPPPVKGRMVFIVDFSFPRTILEGMAAEAQSLILLDHHKTAEEELGNLDYCLFDMSHSGAYLAWSFLFPEKDIPILIRCIEDRDLWRWSIPDSKAILAYVDSFDKDFGAWDDIHRSLNSVSGYEKIIGEGSAILRYKDQLVETLVRQAFCAQIGGDIVPVVNAPVLQSDVASRLAKNHPYSIAYRYSDKGYSFSMRSEDCGADVSELAKKLGGGGGHKRASGFFIDSENLIIKKLGKNHE